MANPSVFLLLISLLLTTILITAVWATETSGVHHLSWVPTTTTKPGSCHGSTTECMTDVDDDEFEINKRILQTANSRYISYGALLRDTVPCSRRGASYYNCQPGAEANPYNRGCSAITRCRG